MSTNDEAAGDIPTKSELSPQLKHALELIQRSATQAEEALLSLTIAKMYISAEIERQKKL